MKKIIKYIPILFLSILFSSCLESGLEDLPAFSEANITKMRFEYRWTDESSDYGKMKLIQLTCNATIDTTANTVNCVVTVPASNAAFPEAIRSQVNQSNIVGYADISTAAILKPLGTAPTLGVPGDFSQSNMQYEITAANGRVKIWTLSITAFNK